MGFLKRVGILWIALLALAGCDTWVLSVNPSQVTLAPGAQQHFEARGPEGMLVNDVDIEWSVTDPQGGTIDADGVYTAPATPGIYTVVANSIRPVRLTAIAIVTVEEAPPPLVEVSIAPATAQVLTGGQIAFTATVTNASDTSVTWSVLEPDGGTIDSSGLYTAPGTPGVYTVVATSVADPTRSAQAVVTVVAPPDPVVVTISPPSAVVETGEQVAFTAVVAGTPNTAVVWSVLEPGGGSISVTGLYTAPGTPGVYTVVATSVADPTSSAQAVVTVVAPPDPVVVTIAPPSAHVLPGEQLAFSVTVTGTPNTAVVWSVLEPNGGTIDSSGLYTAPDSAGTFHVVVTSVADPSAFDTAEIVVEPEEPVDLDFLSAERRTVWNPGLNPVGGIPADDDPVRPAIVYLPPGNPYNGYSVDPGLTSAADATPAIQAAIDAAAAQASENSRRIVLLPPGTFRIASGDGLELQSYVTLRGQGPRGPNATRLVKPNDTVRPVVTLGHIWLQTTQHVALAADVPHGTRQVTVVSNPGYRVGERVFISQREDYTNVGSRWNPVNQASTDVRGWYSRNNRPTGQVLEIEAVNGNTLTFNTPIRLPYFVANGAEITRFSGWVANGPAVPTYSWMGVEDLYMRRGELGTVKFVGAAYSWAKNIETEESFDGGVVFQYAFRCTLRDSFIHSTGWPEPGGAGYGVDVTFYSADNLIENNILWRFNKVMSFRASGGGNVVAYNYAEDGYGASYPQIPEVGLNASHYATPHHELFEGNQAWNVSGDSYWGNSIYMTFFRNHVTGRRRSVPPLQLVDLQERRFVDVPEWHIGYSFVGNVLGTPGMSPAPQSGFVYENAPPWRFDPVPLWTIGPQFDSGLGGQDPRVAATTLRHGNYDYLNNAVIWDPAIPQQQLPRSLYLDEKPAFFGNRPWPWVVPEDPSTQIHSLPARERFDQLMGL